MLKNALIVLAATLLSACLSPPAAEETPMAPENEPEIHEVSASLDDLIGSWDVSLFFAPDAPPSKTVMIVESVEDGVVTGSFYNSTFLVARAIERDGEVLFTAVTEDGSGRYVTSGELEDGVIEGSTLSIGRDFLMAWEARPMVETGE